ncbi:MAG: hypothetical protein Q7J16_02720 [Candidatus Cloacimonadales bacterium]|nr:hypothetical protein [Candidatus Cloacimonadales bacterium]
MTKAVRTNYLFLDYIKRYGSWHQFIGAPKFPEYPLFKPDSSYRKSSKVELLYDSEGNIHKITGENDSSDKVSIEFTFNEITKKGKVELKKNSTVELTVNEWIENEVVTLETKFASDSKYNTEVRCSLVSGNTYEMEVDINNKTLEGNIVLGSEEIPQIAYDIVDELDDLKSNATVAAFDEVLSYSLAAEIWRRAAFGTDDVNASYANAVICLVIDLWCPPMSLVAGLICLLIIWGNS